MSDTEAKPASPTKRSASPPPPVATKDNGENAPAAAATNGDKSSPPREKRSRSPPVRNSSRRSPPPPPRDRSRDRRGGRRSPPRRRSPRRRSPSPRRRRSPSPFTRRRSPRRRSRSPRRRSPPRRPRRSRSPRYRRRSPPPRRSRTPPRGDRKRSLSKARDNGPGADRRSASGEPAEKRSRRSGWDIGENNTKEIAPAALQAQAVLQQQQAAALMQQRLLLIQQQQQALTNRMQNRIYVGSLSYELTEEDVRQAFEPFGAIMSIDMPKEYPGRSKGFCFMEFMDPAAAQRSIDAMNGFMLSGRSIKVGRPTAMSRTTPSASPMMPGGIPGMGGGVATPTAVNPALLGANPNSTGMTADMIKQSVQNAIEQARSGIKPAPTANRRVYVGSIPWDMTAENIKQIFEAFGAITSCQLLPNPETGKHRGYGFVEFVEEKAAKDAVESMNGFNLCGRQLKVGPAKGATNMQPTMPGAPGGPPGMGAAALPPGIPAPSASAAVVAPAKAQTQGNPRFDALVAEAQQFVGESRCVVMLNMVTPEEVDDDLKAEVQEECQNYGSVQQVIVHTSDPDAHEKDASAVQIYVLYGSIRDAVNGRTSLDQRWFGGRVLKALFFDEGRFLVQNFLGSKKAAGGDGGGAGGPPPIPSGGGPPPLPAGY